MSIVIDSSDLIPQVETYCRMGAICVPIAQKKPLCKWKGLSMQLSLDTFSKATGIAVINGEDNWRCIDIDHCKNSKEPVSRSVVDVLLHGLELPLNYPWVVKSGSGHGYHIWFKAEDNSSVSSTPWYVPLPKFIGGFDHIEIRWRECYTILPPSLHDSGNRYSFEGEIPTEAPSYVTHGKIFEALARVSVPKSGTNDGSKVGCTSDTPTASGFSTGIDASLEKVRKEFDLLTSVKKFLGTEIVESVGHEYRVGEAGSGLGGWHVTKDNREWNTFLDGSGKLGGDCFDFVGYLVYKAEWNRKNAQQFKHVLKTMHRMVGNNYVLPPHDSTSEDEHKSTCAEIVQRFMAQIATFRFNVVTSQLEWTPLDMNLWQPIKERQVRMWIVDIEKSTGLILPYERWRTYIDNPEQARPFDPFKAYFDGLVWDKLDHFDYLVSCVEVEMPEEFKRFLFRWLLGTYACAYYGGQTHRNEMFFVLTGAQGAGKTTLIRSLVPKALDSYVHRGIIDESKDTTIRLMESFLSINDELSTLRKTDIESLKARISEDKISVRKPYGREAEEKLRRVSYCGTTNEAEFLPDVTGNRRFLVFELKGIDRTKLSTVSIDGLWAQIQSYFKEGHSHFLNEIETALLENLNQRYRMVSQIEELLQRYFEPADLADPTSQKLTTTQVFEKIAIEHESENSSPSRAGVPRMQLTTATLRLLGTCLKALGFSSTSHRPNGGSPRKCWVLKQKPRQVISPQVYQYPGPVF